MGKKKIKKYIAKIVENVSGFVLCCHPDESYWTVKVSHVINVAKYWSVWLFCSLNFQRWSLYGVRFCLC